MKRMLCPGCVEHHGYMCSWIFHVPDGKCPHCGSTVVDEDELERQAWQRRTSVGAETMNSTVVDEDELEDDQLS